jgi:hypothetical protein
MVTRFLPLGYGFWTTFGSALKIKWEIGILFKCCCFYARMNVNSLGGRIMTIVAAVKVYDGLVLGADSATQIMGPGLDGSVQLLKTYQNARKLFQFQDLPIGILTYGIGNIGKKSIETLLRDFDRANPVSKSSMYSVQEVTTKVMSFFKSAYDEKHSDIKDIEKKPVLGFYVAGYSNQSTEGEEWEFVLPKHTEPVKVREKNIFGSSWRGISIPFSRLYFGFDPRAKQDLIAKGIDQKTMEAVLDNYRASVIYDGMPIKVAVEFVKFILRTTIGLASYEVGAPSCSEPISVALIEQKGVFKFLENS